MPAAIAYGEEEMSGSPLLEPAALHLTDDSAAQEWIKGFEETTKALNSDVDVKLFEVCVPEAWNAEQVHLSVANRSDPPGCSSSATSRSACRPGTT